MGLIYERTKLYLGVVKLYVINMNLTCKILSYKFPL